LEHAPAEILKLDVVVGRPTALIGSDGQAEIALRGVEALRSAFAPPFHVAGLEARERFHQRRPRVEADVVRYCAGEIDRDHRAGHAAIFSETLWLPLPDDWP
jgi:hypothetical protein